MPIFYSSPDKLKNTQLADYLVSSLHLLASKYPESALILGADRNSMDISPILNCGLKLRQMFESNMRGQKILDILIINTGKYCNSAIIAPPIQPDDPKIGKPNDHSVPICNPRINCHNPPIRIYRIMKYSPQSSLQKFGEWITSHSWYIMHDVNNPTELVSLFENIMSDKLNEIFHEKSMKLGSQDKPFITAELKNLHRKTEKYHELRTKFDNLYKHKAQSYLHKTIDELRNTNPGKMYSVLKLIGSKPGDLDQETCFSLPSHEAKGLSHE